jgi:RecA-family ATPase
MATGVGEDNYLMTFSGENLGRPTPLMGELVDNVSKQQPGLIVLDTAADTFGGSENIRRQVHQFIAQVLGRLVKASGATVLLCAHPSKIGVRTGSGDGGSTGWNNSLRARLYLHRSEADSPERVLSRKKSNYGPVEGEALVLAWQQGTFVRQDGAGAEAALMRHTAKEVFLAVFDELIAAGEELSASINSSRYAPKKMALMPSARNMSTAQLVVAMRDLLADRTLREVVEGPRSKARKILVRAAVEAVAADEGTEAAG